MAKPPPLDYGSGGGRVQPPPPKKHKHGPGPGAGPGPHIPTAREAVDAAFAHVVSQIKANTSPLDVAAIRAPYDAAITVAGQLDQGPNGLQQSVLNSGQAAQNQDLTQYAKATQVAGAFGAGTGAPTPTMPDTAAGRIAEQTAQQAAAVPMQTAMWSGILNRLAAGKVADAGIARQSGIDTAIQTATARLPDLYGAEQDRRLQSKTENDNLRLAYASLGAKGRIAYQQALVAKYGVDSRAGSATADRLSREGIAAAKLAAGTAAEADKVSHWNAQEKRLRQTAKALKLNGVPQILAALKPPTTKSTKTQQGYYADVQQTDLAGVVPGSQTRVYFTTPTYSPPAGSGYALIPGSSPQPYYVTNAAVTAGFSWARYKHAASLAKTLNPWLTPAQIRSLLGPTPSTSTNQQK